MIDSYKSVIFGKQTLWPVYSDSNKKLLNSAPKQNDSYELLH